MKYIKQIVINLVFMIPAIAVFSYNDYVFYAKAIYYVMAFIGIVGTYITITNEESLFSYYKRYKDKDSIYWFLNFVYDAAMLAIFAIIQFKLLFVLYFITILLQVALIYKCEELKKDGK